MIERMLPPKNQPIGQQNNDEKEMPSISIVIPVYNEERNLPTCLSSVLNQNYPKRLIEIIVVDDNSSDRTLEIAKKFGARILTNGSKNCERGKSIGLDEARRVLVLFLDADNYLPDTEWLLNMVRPFCENEKLVGAQSAHYHYRPNDSILDRYMALSGTNDPLAFYLGRKDKLAYDELRWTSPGNIVNEDCNYSTIKFSTKDLPTVGANGFLARRDLLLSTDHYPFYFHIDSIYDLIKMGYDTYAMVYTEIGHNHATSFRTFVKKLIRNAALYFKTYKTLRRYKWYFSRQRSPYAVLAMSLPLISLFDAARGYSKVRDRAWLYHPLACIFVLMGYVGIGVQNTAIKVIDRIWRGSKET
jgi:glycosyltransferase involved in cell wall biosynthesis